MKALLIMSCFFLSNVFADVSLRPGESQYITSGTYVSCSNTAERYVIRTWCECKHAGSYSNLNQVSEYSNGQTRSVRIKTITDKRGEWIHWQRCPIEMESHPKCL